jgi:hypothetical protein
MSRNDSQALEAWSMEHSRLICRPISVKTAETLVAKADSTPSISTGLLGLKQPQCLALAVFRFWERERPWRGVEEIFYCGYLQALKPIG